MKQRMTFDEWMKLVDRNIEYLANVSREDLADCCYWDWYDDGMTHIRAARKAIKNSQE